MPTSAAEREAELVKVSSRFYVARGADSNGAFDFALERRGDDALALLAVDARGRVVALRGQAIAEPSGAFRFALDAIEHRAGKRGVHVEGRVASSLVRELEVRDPDRKSPSATTIAGPSLEPAFDQAYAGSLGARAHVRMKLSRVGSALSGVYRYAQSAEDLRLAGHVSEGATFELDETTSGRITGHFSGALVGSVGLVARWTSADGKRSEDVTLFSGSSYPETYAMTANVGRVVPQERYVKAAPFCEDSRITPAFQSLTDPSAERALDATLAQQESLFAPPLAKRDCDGASDDTPFERTQTYAIDGERAGFVGMTSSIHEFTGGAHGSYASRCFVADLAKHVVVRLATQLTPAGHAKVRALVIHALERASKVTKLTDAGFFEDAPTLADADLCFSVSGNDGKLRVDFPLYAIAPYVMGMPSATLDGKDVSGVFQPGTTGAILFP